MQLALPQITAAGGTLVAISPQVQEYSRQTGEHNQVTFDILCDPGNAVAKLFGLVFSVPAHIRTFYLQSGIDFKAMYDQELSELTITATYIIDRQGTIVHAFVDADHTRRMEPDDIVAVLRNMRS